jgi:PhnB protein
MTQINAYLSFSGNTREVMNFYKDCLGGELTMMTIGESPVASQMPPEAKDQIMHASLTNKGIVLMASDMSPNNITKGNNISLMLNCSSEEEINGFYSKLSAGGQASHPPKKEFWGAVFGNLTDKFGIQWMLNYNQAVEQSTKEKELAGAIE